MTSYVNFNLLLVPKTIMSALISYIKKAKKVYYRDSVYYNILVYTVKYLLRCIFLTINFRRTTSLDDVHLNSKLIK